MTAAPPPTKFSTSLAEGSPACDVNARDEGMIADDVELIVPVESLQEQFIDARRVDRQRDEEGRLALEDLYDSRRGDVEAIIDGCAIDPQVLVACSGNAGQRKAAAAAQVAEVAMAGIVARVQSPRC